MKIFRQKVMPLGYCYNTNGIFKKHDISGFREVYQLGWNLLSKCASCARGSENYTPFCT